jgi:DNA helicase-2/ATP-dependent DNA helicase PcrA
VANAVIRSNRGRRYEKDLRTDRKGGVPVREIRCCDEEDEALVVAREAAAWLAQGRDAGDIAVFYRVNAQSRLLERGLTEQGIPYVIVGAVEFYKRKEVKDVLAYVRLARNPADGAAFWRILNVPTRGIGKTTAERLREAAERTGRPARSILRDREGLTEFGRARKALERLAELLDALEALDPERPAPFVQEVVERTRYRDFLGEGTPQAETDRIENVRELVNAAAEYERREPHGGIDGFLEENALVSDQDAYDERVAAVTLMTVHSAKGLEFPCVLTVGLEEQLFPHALSLEEPEELDEERRLFYVAVTRAQDELVLLHGQLRRRAGLPEPARPSRFLDEIPDELLDVEDRTHDPFGPAFDEPVVRDEAGPDFRPGDRVRHGHFGRGRVVAVRKSGGATRITVDFDQAGRRELALAYANLERL